MFPDPGRNQADPEGTGRFLNITMTRLNSRLVDEEITPAQEHGSEIGKNPAPRVQERYLIITPAATAEPMTPATFGPIACINRKF